MWTLTTKLSDGSKLLNRVGSMHDMYDKVFVAVQHLPLHKTKGRTQKTKRYTASTAQHMFDVCYVAVIAKLEHMNSVQSRNRSGFIRT